jgi:Ca2+-binding EF-hand superfamily protein
VGKLDTLDEGIVNKENLKKAIMDLKVSDLELEELNTFCKLCDKQSKGYISTNKFIEQLYNMANESECDVILRRLSKTLQHQDLNLPNIMKGYDTKGTGRIDK